jgi:integrase
MIRLHELRHSFASQLAMKSVPLRGIQELLGHSDIRLTVRYAHLSPSLKSEYVELLDEDPSCPISAPMGQIGGGFGGRWR